MESKGAKMTVVSDNTFYLRKLTKAGSSRYLSVGTLLPKDWTAVKVYVVDENPKGIQLFLEPIK
tara:strand:+ start:1540 stop:1731 length:192 start_codon:yes stop_codon:yes gene_type:complete